MLFVTAAGVKLNSAHINVKYLCMVKAHPSHHHQCLFGAPSGATMLKVSP